jgi:DNA-binding response OmpR family regulator
VKILIVDDESSFVTTLVDALSPDYEVAGITGGADVIDWVKRGRYEVVLLDIHLPDSNGLQLVGELKKACPGTYVILISGMVPGFSRNQAVAAGADDFMSKPIELRRLKSVLEDLSHSMKLR